MEKLLAIRRALKAKKPAFTRQDAHKKPSLGKKWRRPKGIHSKMREYRKGHGSRISKGWKSPACIRGLDRTGLKPIVVASSKAIGSLKAGVHGIVIQSSVGMKKRIGIVEEALKKKITLLNLRKPEEFLANVKEELAKRKQAKTQHEAEKAKKEKEQQKQAEKKTEQKKDKEEKTQLTEEERKEQEKKELDKLLTKPE